MSEFPKEIYCDCRCNNVWSVRDKATDIILVEDLEEDAARELVRRWNSQPALLEACERYVRMQDEINQEMGRKPTNTMYHMMKAAIAAANKT